MTVEGFREKIKQVFELYIEGYRQGNLIKLGKLEELKHDVLLEIVEELLKDE